MFGRLVKINNFSETCQIRCNTIRYKHIQVIEVKNLKLICFLILFNYNL